MKFLKVSYDRVQGDARRVELSDEQRSSLQLLIGGTGYDGAVAARAQIVLWRAERALRRRYRGHVGGVAAHGVQVAGSEATVPCRA